ncbi:AraC family transcriptional regulator [Aromatoleum anaerobium]|uniref:Helix-turn-helix domain-containing protein n=1 Tax=Aromatoleum anaerobium TaxID=182180 RepID=A0ABX1PFP7_9RHOO|nr:AraC family transcriptional regulator [Aromatoleum anaerobium]MCK0509052.1 AraC family transcriptional regulator [Aromatoleum anaerobium]
METQHRFGAAASVPVLANSLLFRTSDLEEARDRVSRVFCSHRLRVVGERGPIGAEMYFRQIRGIGVGRILYGASVVIEPGQLDSFALIQMPISGAEVVEHGGETVNSTPDVASVVSPTLPVRMRHGADTEKLVVKIDRDALERHCRQHLGGNLRQPVEFRPEMSLVAPRSLSWVRLMNWLCDEVGQERSGEDTILDSPLFSAQIEQMVIATLLLSQPHNYSERLEDNGPSIAPHFIRKVERFIDENAQEPLTIGELAEHAGVSTRSLFAGFRKYRSTTPMHYLKDVRLQRVREVLLQASPDSTTVTNVAMQWGFSHLGHFTSDYKRAFGESPSATLGR